MSLLTAAAKHTGPGRPGFAPVGGGGGPGGGGAVSIPLTVTRLAAGSGTTLVSNGVPLLEGQLLEADLDTVQVFVADIEQAVYVEALEGVYPDGSLRSVLVQFSHTLDASTPLTGALTIGTARGTTDISKTTISTQPNLVYPIDSTRAELPQELGQPAGVALPSEVSHLVSWCSAVFGPTESSAVASARGTPWDEVETDYETFSQAYWDWRAVGMTPDTRGTTLSALEYSQNYYDRALHEFMHWCRTGTLAHFQRGCSYAFGWRAAYAQPGGYDLGPHQYLVEGQIAYYYLTGDAEARNAAHVPANAYRVTWHGQLGSTLDWGGEARPMGRILMAYILNHELGYTDHAWDTLATEAVAKILGAVGTGQTACWEQSATGAWSWEKTCPIDAISNFQQAICADALLRYVDRINGSQATAAEAAVKKVVDRLWNTQWRASDTPTPSFNYYAATCSGFGSVVKSIDVSGNYPHLFAWLASRGHGSTYGDHAATIMATLTKSPNDGTTGPYWISLTVPSWQDVQMKNWNEANWASWRTTGYLAAGGL